MDYFSFSFFEEQQGTQHITGTVSNEATNDMGYQSCGHAGVPVSKIWFSTVEKAGAIRCFYTFDFDASLFEDLIAIFRL